MAQSPDIARVAATSPTWACLRLVRALAVETHENWLEAIRYLNMEHLKEHKKEALRAAA
jgi:putative transposase